jgi:hypothetical protein
VTGSQRSPAKVDHWIARKTDHWRESGTTRVPGRKLSSLPLPARRLSSWVDTLTARQWLDMPSGLLRFAKTRSPVRHRGFRAIEASSDDFMPAPTVHAREVPH